MLWPGKAKGKLYQWGLHIPKAKVLQNWIIFETFKHFWAVKQKHRKNDMCQNRLFKLWNNMVTFCVLPLKQITLAFNIFQQDVDT